MVLGDEILLFYDYMVQDLCHFVHDKWERPGEEVHAVRQREGLLFALLVLLDVHPTIFKENYGSLVQIGTTIVWGGEDRDDGGKSLRSTPSMKLVAIRLNFMSADYA